MGSTPRSFADIFVGTKEVKKVYTLIGWIAVNHARLEQHLDYLQWQLDVFEVAGRRASRDKTDEEIRNLSRTLTESKSRKSSRIEDRVRHVTDHLMKCRASRRLDEIGERERTLKLWEPLGAKMIALSARRNAVIHSSVSWCAGSVIRETSWQHDDPYLPLDLDRDNQLNSSIANALTMLNQFSTELAQLLPFKGYHKIISSIARIELPHS
jgi:hypothetical protein